MKTRCYNPNYHKFHIWGGKGVRVCDKWRENFKAFEQWALANGYAEHLTIDRYTDTNGHYEPKNCRWAT